MNRKYSESQIKELVEYINLKFENAFIGSDIIVGFPDETIEDFEKTYNNLADIELTKIHVFPYSQRKGTLACTMKNQVKIEEKKKRVSLIQELSNKKLKHFFEKNINKENEVIIEKNRDKKTGLLKGVTKNYINVLIDDTDNFKDTLQKVVITDFSSDDEKMIAKILT
jgi:threonylcarbamoyladenosine tRNA methylthiotransferase MtaB